LVGTGEAARNGGRFVKVMTLRVYWLLLTSDNGPCEIPEPLAITERFTVLVTRLLS